ncbi:GspE/PulE family protein [Delftia sp. GW456-R20]|uniref:GspE/PulE family protein n=1 Tax=Delftia sp. GW456-R20 TaxID=1827145 RepID=UPI000A485895|nr:ATPase, T2SS/T4P/T4SS family [Delftia sp. GW456-R20]
MEILHSRAAADNSPRNIEIVKEFHSVPAGTAITKVALDSFQRKSMVAIETKPGEAAILVVPESYGTGAALNLKKELVSNGYQVRFLRATSDVIEHTHNKYAGQTSETTSAATKPEKLITEILQSGLEKGASDIHVETRLPTADVFLRIDGALKPLRNLTYETAASLAQVLFLKGEEGSKDIDWNYRTLADCGIKWKLDDGEEVGIRFSSLPIAPNPNFHFVLRLQSLKEESIELKDCGYTADQLGALDTLLGASKGITIFCGPTNSGKSESLAGCMRRIYQMRGTSIKVITAENPVEKIVPGACQVSVGGSMDYATVLRGILRQDADVVVPGEIRDVESAGVVRDMVLAGRKALSTVHAHSAIGTYVRLRELGIPWDLLSMPGFINGIVYQRLVPTLCDGCKIPLMGGGVKKISPAVFQRLSQVTSLANPKLSVQGEGCPKCDHSGISGRTAVAEFLIPDTKFLRLLEKGELASAEQHWKEGTSLAIGRHGVTALAHAIYKMEQGILDPVAIEEHVEHLTTELSMASREVKNAPAQTYGLTEEEMIPQYESAGITFRKTGT